MEAIIAKVRSLAGEADEAGRANIRSALHRVLSDLETPKDTLMGLFNKVYMNLICCYLICTSLLYPQLTLFQHLQIATVRLGIELGLFRSLSQSEATLQVSQLAEQSGASSQLLGKVLMQFLNLFTSHLHLYLLLNATYRTHRSLPCVK
jgi:demethylsterigmatocystin 6-O-methyltransferase